MNLIVKCYRLSDQMKYHLPSIAIFCHPIQSNSIHNQFISLIFFFSLFSKDPYINNKRLMHLQYFYTLKNDSPPIESVGSVRDLTKH